ncbi:hypothetical protein [Virgibacillus sp. DJP39]|uniref:hypothetical protein n=1 Tax=Virgibacillus sp. DJP39 TaxID=3409790 RepID=UPI003BB66BC8
MSKKVLLSIIVVLIFAVAVNIYTESVGEKDRIAEIKKVKKENDNLKQKNDKLKIEIQKLEKNQIINAAKHFKVMQYNVNYDENYEFQIGEIQGKIKKKLGDYATENGLRNVALHGVFSFIRQLSQETKSNLSVKDIKIYEKGIDTSAQEINLDYDIKVVINPVVPDGKERIISDFGQIRLVKTNEGWKVDADSQQMDGLFEIMYQERE